MWRKRNPDWNFFFRVYVDYFGVLYCKTIHRQYYHKRTLYGTVPNVYPAPKYEASVHTDVPGNF